MGSGAGHHCDFAEEEHKVSDAVNGRHAQDVRRDDVKRRARRREEALAFNDCNEHMVDVVKWKCNKFLRNLFHPSN